MLALGLFGLCTALVHWLWEPFDEAFFERDPSLSLVYYDDTKTRLPIAVIIFLAIGVPLILTFTMQMILRFWRRPHDIHPKAIDPFYAILIQALALSVNGLFSEFLKSYVGKKRPNFFAMCNYKGYRDALATNNFTSYLANTDPNRFGSMAYCLDQSTFISWQSRSSYPSGHASYSFCGFAFFGLLSIYVWHCITRKQKALKVIYFMCLMLVALVLSWSRKLDYWHDCNDIYAGGAIGAVIGVIMFFLNYSFSTVDKLKKKIEDISNKQQQNTDKDKSAQDTTITENNVNV